MPAWFIYLSLLLANSTSFFTLFLTLRKISHRNLCNAFVILIITAMLYYNPLLVFYLPTIDPGIKLMLSWLVFVGILAFVASFSIFIILFTDFKQELTHWRFICFETCLVLLIISILSGEMVTGIREQVKLSYGRAYPFFVFIACVTPVYWSYLIIKGYRKCQDSILRFQIKWCVCVGLLTMFAMVATNALLPALTGSSRYSAVGSLEIMILCGNILYILLKGEERFAISQTKSLFRKADEKIAVANIIRVISSGMDKDSSFVRQFNFIRKADQKNISLYVGNQLLDDSNNNAMINERRVPSTLFMEQRDSLHNLQKENQRLSMTVAKARSVFDEKKIKIGKDFEALLEKGGAARNNFRQREKNLEKATKYSLSDAMKKLFYHIGDSSRSFTKGVAL